MNVIQTQTSTYPAWRTYSKAVGMLIPVICAWWFSMIWPLPKLREIWSITHFTHFIIEPIINIVVYIGVNCVPVSIPIFVVLCLLEWRSVRWPRYRAAVMYTIVLLMVSGMFLFLLSMLTSALLAAPALRHI